MLRIACLLTVLVPFVPGYAADSPPPSARRVSLKSDNQTIASIAADIRKQTGNEVDVSAIDAARRIVINLERADFWTAIERLAEQTQSRVAVSGGKVVLKPSKHRPIATSHGPFRISVREINVRGDAEAGTATYDLTLDVAWEPWLLAYRIDSTPSKLEAKGANGRSLAIASGAGRTLTAGNTATLTVRPTGIERTDRTVSLKGSFRVTIADELLTFVFDGVSGKPIGEAQQKGVTASVVRQGAEGTEWFAVVDLHYPKSDVTWESHEYGWHSRNVMRLIPPNGQPIKADQVEQADFRYGFKGFARRVGNGWKLEYRTPGPMREIVVPFELKDVPLP